MKHATFFLLPLAALLSLSGCQKEAIDPTNAQAGYTGYNGAGLLRNTASSIILSNYQDLDQKAAALAAAAAALQNRPAAATLEAARQAYRDARGPWEATEAFAFGPVATQGLDAVIDTWPLNRVDLRNVLASSAPITAASLSQLEGGLQGFHPVEYLLFGEDGSKALGSFTGQEYQFLTAATQNLNTATSQLLTYWQPTGGNFAAKLATAGPGNATYPSQKAALQELVNGLIGAADELGNSKMDRPLVLQSTDFEEAKYSRNSKAEFLQNLRGIENVYQGRYQQAGTGVGLAALVQQRNAAVDARFRQELTDAQTAVVAIPGTFGEAIFQNKAAVQAAQAKVRAVQSTLENQIAPFINSL